MDNNENLIGFYNYNDLKKLTNLYFNAALTDNQLPYLDNIKENATIVFDYKDEDYDNVLKIIDNLKPGINCIIKLHNKELFNHSLNKYLKKTNKMPINLYVDYDFASYCIKDYFKQEQILYKMIEEARDLSPLEKYLYAYNITKQFKKYQNSYDMESSRNLYQILNNDYMVCVGYEELLGDLLNKLGIESTKISCSVDINLTKNENVDMVNYEDMEKAWHARRLVRISDEKYQVNGLYFSDPTWDNRLLNDYYNHALMTVNDIKKNHRYHYFNRKSVYEVYECLNLDEYYQILNMILKSKHNDKNLLFYELLKSVGEIDSMFYKEIVDYYKVGTLFIVKNSVINEIVLKIGNYIVNLNNNKVSKEIFTSALTNLYDRYYGYNDTKDAVNRVLELNEKRHLKKFPIRYKIDKNNNLDEY